VSAISLSALFCHIILSEVKAVKYLLWKIKRYVLLQFLHLVEDYLFKLHKIT